MVDAHCVPEEGGFTLHWLVLRFIRLGLSGIGYMEFKEYVNHFLE